MKIQNLFLFCFLFLSFVSVSSANVNLTFQSNDPKIIQAIRISDNTIVATHFNNETFNLPYDNYLFKINSNIVFGSSGNTIGNHTVYSNAKSLIADRYLFIWIFILIAIILSVYYWIRSL